MSSSDVAVRVKDVSKSFQFYDSPGDRLKQFIIPRLQSTIGLEQRRYFHEFWALRNVSLEILKGETVGIIGRNGSGKSTLLQIICGTVTPTSGSVETSGRIAALLELGSGFNPEFTGRENVYMNAAVIGLGKKEIDARFNDIAAFADIDHFIDQPVKTYSSGMIVRLAFAVAINVDPEILVVDEALSVGDELFQRKCLSRIESIRENGATILFVSHSGGTIIELCDRAVLLDAGEELLLGAPKHVVGRYQKLLYAPRDKQNAIREQIRRADEPMMKTESINECMIHEDEESSGQAITLQEYFDPHLKPSSTIDYESHGAYIESPTVLTLAGERVNNVVRGRTYCYMYTVRFTKAANNVQFGMLVKSTSGVELGGGVSASSPRCGLIYIEAGSSYRVEFTFRCALNPGVYFLNAGVVGAVDGIETYLHRLLDCTCIKVIGSYDGFFSGVIDFDITPDVTRYE